MSLFDSASVVITPSGYKEDKLYSIKPTDGSGDLVVTRATTATRVNSDGLIEVTPYNLLTYSEQFDNVSWTKFGVSVTTNTTTAPNGTLTADSIIENSASATQHRIGKFAIPLTSGTTYTISAYVKRGIGNRNVQFGGSGSSSWIRVYFDLTNETVGSQVNGTGTITNVGNGWYRITATGVSDLTGNNTFYLANTNGTTVGSETYNGDGTSSIIWWGAQLVTGTSAKEYFPTTDRLDVPRLDYTNSSCPSILVEPQRTNLLLRSEEFDNASWAKENATISANATTSPSGLINADKIIDNSTNAAHGIFQPITFVSGTTYSLSFYLKKGEKSILQVFFNFQISTAACNFDANTGTFNNQGFTNASMQSVGNDWYRCSITFTSIGSGSYNNIFIIVPSLSSLRAATYVGNGTDGLFLWGAQLEVGSYATSYIPTIASSVTRNADVISKTGISSLIGQTEGTLFCEIKKISSESGAYILEISDNSNTNRIIIQNDVVANRLRFFAQSASGVQLNTSPANVFTDYVKIAFSYANNYYSIYANGIKILSGTTFNVPTCDKLNIGSRYNNSSYFGGSINSAILWKTALTDTELAQLTTI